MKSPSNADMRSKANQASDRSGEAANCGGYHSGETSFLVFRDLLIEILRFDQLMFKQTHYELKNYMSDAWFDILSFDLAEAYQKVPK